MFNKRKFIAPILLFCLTAGACGSSAEPVDSGVTLAPPEIKEESFNFAEVTDGEIHSEQIFTDCELYSPESTMVYSSISGTIKNVVIARNQKVHSGDILMTIALPTATEMDILETEVAYDQQYRAYLLERAEREAEIAEEKANLAALPENSSELRRRQEQVDRLEENLASYIDRTLSTLGNLKSSLDNMKNPTTEMYVYATCDGYLTATTTSRAGSTFRSGDYVATISSVNDRLIKVRDRNGVLRYGMKVDISHDFSENFHITGTVISAKDVLPSEHWTGYAYIRPDNALVADSWTGYTVKAILKDVSNLCIINSRALYSEDKRRYVLIYDNGVTTKQYVNVGTSNNDTSWILNGVSVGQQLMMRTGWRRR